MTDPIHICFASDDNYAKYMGLAICSILRSSSDSDKFVFYVLDDNIGLESREKVESLRSIKDFQIYWIGIDTSEFKGVDTKKLPWSALSRFLIPRYIPSSQSKVLYLDCDVFARSSLASLFNEDISAYYAGAIVDYCVKSRGWPQVLYQSSDSNDLTYFNSGVFLINLDLWRQDGIDSLLIEDVKKHSGRYRYTDQDALNIVLKTKIKSLDPRWNVMDYFFSPDLFLKEPIYKELDEIVKNPYIRHFKGWKRNNLFPYRDEYLKLMKDSPWSEYIEQDDPRWLQYVKTFFSYMWKHPLCFLLPRFYKRWYYRGFLGLIRS